MSHHFPICVHAIRPKSHHSLSSSAATFILSFFGFIAFSLSTSICYSSSSVFSSTPDIWVSSSPIGLASACILLNRKFFTVFVCLLRSFLFYPFLWIFLGSSVHLRAGRRLSFLLRRSLCFAPPTDTSRSSSGVFPNTSSQATFFDVFSEHPLRPEKSPVFL